MYVCLGTNRRNMLGIKGQQKAWWRSIFDSGRFSMFDSCRERENRPTSVPLPGRNQLLIGCSEVIVLIAVFDPASCCSVEPAGGVGEWK